MYTCCRCGKTAEMMFYSEPNAVCIDCMIKQVMKDKLPIDNNKAK